MIVRVGSEECPAGLGDIAQVRQDLNYAISNNVPFVTCHTVDIDLLPIDEVVNLKTGEQK